MAHLKEIIASVVVSAFALVTALVLISGLGSAVAGPEEWQLWDEKPNSCCCCYGKGLSDCKMKYLEDCQRTGGKALMPFDPDRKPGKTKCERGWD